MVIAIIFWEGRGGKIDVLEISKRGVFLRNDDETYFPLWAKLVAAADLQKPFIFWVYIFLKGLHAGC